ncbi:MAG TPA: hypothetical protein VET29_20775, partial [Actinophytocola sp.]|nr:hypothetical protein [Actinophytocola sp.]
GPPCARSGRITKRTIRPATNADTDPPPAPGDALTRRGGRPPNAPAPYPANGPASLGAISESLAYLTEVVKKQRAEPGDGLLGMIIKDHGDQVSDQELAGLADGILTGGFETTASMLALGALVLLQDRDTFELVHDDDAAIHGFVEEVLRYLTAPAARFAHGSRQAKPQRSPTALPTEATCGSGLRRSSPASARSCRHCG